MDKNNATNISRMLEFEEENSDLSFVDDDMLDPDYCLPNIGNSDLGGILAFNSDSENESDTNNVVLQESDIINELCNGNNIRELDIIDGTSSDENINPGIGKKRKMNKCLWKRNVAKRNKAEGKQHTSLRKKEISSRSTGPDCLCT